MKDQYKRRTCIGLQPIEVRKIRSYLLNPTGKTPEQIEEDFQLWVMIILSITLFLRFDEVCNLKMSDFEQERFSFDRTGIRGLALYIKGKCDKLKHLFAIRENTSYFDIDPIPVLLIYIIKRRLGTDNYLFPGCRTESYCHETFIRKMKYIMIHVLKKESNHKNIFGTHIWRKTAYAFALVGK